MENNNKNKQLVEFLNNVASFYRKDTSEFYFDVWVRCLANYDMEIIRKAFDSYATNPDASGFMPSTNEILREILGTSTDSSELAWGKALKAIGRAGKSNDVVFDDALIHVVVEDMGGWIKFCSVTDDEVPFQRLQFIKSYQAYRKHGEFPEYPRALTGTSNLYNAANGFRCALPQFIGDPDKASLVFKNGGEGSGLRVSKPSLKFATLLLEKSNEVAA